MPIILNTLLGIETKGYPMEGDEQQAATEAGKASRTMTARQMRARARVRTRSRQRFGHRSGLRENVANLHGHKIRCMDDIVLAML